MQKKVGIGAVIFNDLYNSRIKDEIFDWDTMLNLNGETGPYLQYMYVRTNSVLEKANEIPSIKNIKMELLNDNSSINLMKEMYNFESIVKQSAEKNEPYIISRYLINIAQYLAHFTMKTKLFVKTKLCKMLEYI